MLVTGKKLFEINPFYRILKTMCGYTTAFLTRHVLVVSRTGRTREGQRGKPRLEVKMSKVSNILLVFFYKFKIYLINSCSNREIITFS